MSKLFKLIGYLNIDFDAPSVFYAHTSPGPKDFYISLTIEAVKTYPSTSKNERIIGLLPNESILNRILENTH